MGRCTWAGHRLALRNRCGRAASHQRQQGSRIAADPCVAAEWPAQHRCRLLPDQPAKPSGGFLQSGPGVRSGGQRAVRRTLPVIAAHETRQLGRRRRGVPFCDAGARRSLSATGVRELVNARGLAARSRRRDRTSRHRREKSQMRSRFFRSTATRYASGRRARPAGPPRSSRSPAPRQRHCRILLHRLDNSGRGRDTEMQAMRCDIDSHLHRPCRSE